MLSIFTYSTTHVFLTFTHILAPLFTADAQVWSLMKVICFEDNAREELLIHLGFDKTAVAAAAEEYVRSKNPNALPPISLPTSAPPPWSNSAEKSPPGSLFYTPPAPKSNSEIAGALFDGPQAPRSNSEKASAGDLFDTPTSPFTIPVTPSSTNGHGFVEVPPVRRSVSPSPPPVALSSLSPSAAAATADMVAAALAGEGKKHSHTRIRTHASYTCYSPADTGKCTLYIRHQYPYHHNEPHEEHTAIQTTVRAVVIASCHTCVAVASFI
jgi:hypothetical protein